MSTLQIILCSGELTFLGITAIRKSLDWPKANMTCQFRALEWSWKVIVADIHRQVIRATGPVMIPPGAECLDVRERMVRSSGVGG